MKQKIGPDSVVSQNKALDVTDLDGEKVMMDIENGKYYALNEVGSRIWDIIGSPVSIRDIVGTLMKEYDVDYETCEKAVISFLESVCDAGIIKIC